MNTKRTFVFLFMIISIVSYTNADNNTPMQQSVRGIVGDYDTAIHTKGQVRLGYITFNEANAPRTSGYAVGGHIHFDTARYYGLKLALSAYGVLDLGINQNPWHQNPYFFDAKGKSFVTLSKAFLDGKWGNTQVRLGRQILDTPLADSDDIRMMPNFFEAYTITNTDIDRLTLTAGYIDKMAGWENGVDASRFVAISNVLGASEAMSGVAFIGATYEGIPNASISAWYYRYDDVADVVYAEASYAYAFRLCDTVLSLQYAHGNDSGDALLGKRDASTWGVSLSAEIPDTGVSLMAAYNRDNGQTGAIDLSLGGGPFFTSMEDLTIDAIAGEGTAWVLSSGYDATQAGIDGLNVGIAYGMFRSDTPSTHFHASETDIIVNYTWNDRIRITCAYALVDHKDDGMDDYDQLRVIGSYGF